jgi:hypothetical protein
VALSTADFAKVVSTSCCPYVHILHMVTVTSMVRHFYVNFSFSTIFSGAPTPL